MEVSSDMNDELAKSGCMPLTREAGGSTLIREVWTYGEPLSKFRV